jgi:hypothetical protein
MAALSCIPSGIGTSIRWGQAYGDLEHLQSAGDRLLVNCPDFGVNVVLGCVAGLCIAG